MSDNYGVQVGVDAREADKGLKTLESGLKRAGTALSKFDQQARSVFSRFDAASGKTDFAKLANEAARFGTAAQSIATKLSGSARNLDNFATRASRAFTNLSKSVNAVNFGKAAADMSKFNLHLAGLAGSTERLTKLLNSLSTSARTVTRAMNFNISAGNRSFATIGRQLATFATQIQRLNGVKIDNSLARNINALSAVLSSVRIPPASAGARITAFFRALNGVKVPAGIAGALGTLSAATASFRPLSAAQVKNFLALLAGLQTANASQINAVANALRRLSGFRMVMPPGTAAQLRQLIGLRNRLYQGGGRFQMHGITSGIGQLRGLENAFSATYQASTLLRTGLGTLTLGTFVRGVYDAGTSLLQFDRAIEAVATSQKEVASHKEFINTLTHELPIGLEVAQRTFGKFAVSARLSGESAEETQRIFKSFSTAFAVLKLSTEQQENAFLALEQMFNKGTVQAEELRRQLGQYLPGAFELMAAAIGKTPAQLQNLMQTGEVSAKSVGKLATLVAQIYGGQVPKALLASRSQLIMFGNEWTRFQQSVFSSGFDSGLSAAFSELTKAMQTDTIEDAAKKVGQAFQSIFTNLGALGAVALENWQPISRVIAVLAGVATLSGSVAVLRLMVSPFMMLAALATPLATGLVSVARAIFSLTTYTTIASGVMTAFGAVAAALTSPVWLTVAGVVALGAGLAALIALNDWEGFKEKVKGALGSIADYAGSALSGIGSTFGKSMEPMMKGMTDSFSKHVADIEKRAKQAQATMGQLDDEGFKANAERDKQRQAMADDDPGLNKRRQQLLDMLDPIGKANKQYADQIKLIDELNKRFHEGKNVNFDDAQAKELKARLDRLSLAKRDPFSAEVRDLKEEMSVLKFVGDQRQIEQQILQVRNKLLKEGKILTDEEADALRNLLKARLDLERGGANGFERWANSAKDLREALIDVEKNGVDKLSDALADLSVGKDVDFTKIASGLLRQFNKALIDDLFKDVLKNFKGNSPLASMFGLAAPNADAAVKTAEDLAKKQAESLATRNVAEMSVNAANVTVNGPGFGGATSGGIQSSGLPSIPGSNVSPYSTPSNVNLLKGSSPLAKNVNDLRASLGMPPVKSGVTMQDLPPAITAAPGAGTASAYANVPSPQTIYNELGKGVSYRDISAGSNFRGTMMDPNSVRGVVFHHTAGRGTAEGVQNTLNQRGLGVQYVMDRDGKITQLLPQGMSGAHMLPSDKFVSDGAPGGLSNRNTVGIEMIAKNNADLTKAQIESAQRFYQQMREKYPNAMPFGHGEVNPGHKSLDEGMGAVSAIRNSNFQFAGNDGISGSVGQLQSATAMASGSMTTMAGDITQVGSSAMGATGGLNSFADGLSKMFSSGSVGGGGFNPFSFMGGGVGMFKEGGLSTSPVSFFRHAARFAEGSGSASRAAGSPSLGGGFPAVLHDNEAVIPLTRGREVPVRLTSDDTNSSGGGSNSTSVVLNLHGVKDYDSFRKSKAQMKAELSSAAQLAAQRNN